jgi:4-amino-4-deoxy-L-arabinose transferase-like glycosyltransferase
MKQDREATGGKAGRWRRAVRAPAAQAATVGLLAGIVFLAVYGIRFRELVDPSAMQEAQLARELAEGHGYTTKVLTPLDLYFDRTVRGRVEVATPPLGPLVLALFFRVFGASDGIAALASGVAYALSVVAAWALGRRLAGPAVGWLAAALYGLSATATALSISGTAAALATLLVTLAFAAALGGAPVPADPEATPAGRHANAWCVGSGGALGLAVLAESFLLPLAVPLILFIHSRRRDAWRRPALSFAVGLIVPTAPWVARNWIHTGSPLFSTRQYALVERTWTWPGRVIYQDLTWRTDWPVALVARRPMDFVRKVGRDLADERSSAAGATEFVVAGLLIGLLLLTSPDRTRRAFHLTVVGAVAVQALVGALFTPATALFACLLPAASVVVAERVLDLTRQPDTAPSRRQAAARIALPAGLLLLIVLPTLARLCAAPEQRHHSDAAAVLKAALPPNAFVMTDVPWFVAWYADRPAIELCQTDGQFDTISDSVERIDALYLSGSEESRPVAERGNWWWMAYTWRGSFKNLLPEPLPIPGAVLRVRR